MPRWAVVRMMEPVMSKSPFPGMDPYLEAAWRDVHHSLCTYARDDLQAQLSGGMLARIDERLVVESAPERSRSVYGDVRVVKGQDKGGGGIAVAGGVAVADPITIEFDESAREGFIEVIDARSGGRVITVLEFVSSTNKLPGPGREQYRQKCLDLWRSGVSVVEINLVRMGGFTALFPQSLLAAENRTPYYAVVYRGWTPTACQYYAMPLERRLPAIAIPLRPDDPAVALDIQSLVDRCYRNGAYDQEIDYAKDPVPALEGESAEWARRLLKEAGRR